MFVNAGLLGHKSLCLTLNYTAARKAGPHLTCRLSVKDCSARVSISCPRSLDRTCSTPILPRPRKHIVTCAQASLQSAVQPLLSHDFTAAALAAVGAYVWVRLFDWMATRGVLEQVIFHELTLEHNWTEQNQTVLLLQHRLLAENWCTSRLVPCSY